MIGSNRSSIPRIIIISALVILGLLVIFPLMLILLNSVKDYQEISKSLISLPTKLHFENFPQAFDKMNYGRAIVNSLVTTAFSIGGLILISSMTSYQIIRRKCLASKIIFISIMASMAVPFQALMVPTVIVAKTLGITNEIYGVIILYWGFLLPMAVFLYQGYIKGIPNDLEEAARIDGCGQIRTFFKIVFPLLKPITATVAIINVLAVFNDFALPLIMLSSKDKKTLPLAFSAFYGSYLTEWNLIMAALVITIIPILIFFLFMQKRIMGGLVAGALKG